MVIVFIMHQQAKLTLDDVMADVNSVDLNTVDPQIAVSNKVKHLAFTGELSKNFCNTEAQVKKKLPIQKIVKVYDITALGSDVKK